MRKELNQMEVIEKYITGELTGKEKEIFEAELASNPKLLKELELQKQLLKGIERAGLKENMQQAFKKYKLKKGLKIGVITSLIIGVFALSSVFLYNTVVKSANENAPQELPELNEVGEKLWSDADKYLPLQSFKIQTEKDTVIETIDGIVIAIPANSFVDSEGKSVKGTIDLEVKEALNAIDIMKAGLNTKSGNRLLETGGMFYINARKDEISLKIKSDSPLYAEIPADEVKAGMQLFEGKRLPNGTIDWVNPKPIENYLIPVDISTLNFYPPNYLDSLSSWGYDIKNKKFTDSLYYSFAAQFAWQENVNIYNKAFNEYSEAYNANNPKADSIGYYWFHEGINPSKIKAIWDKKFQNTLLSTKEFEERIPFIHRTCDEQVLNMYVNNLDKKLCEIDSMVARPEKDYGHSEAASFKGYPEFLKFAARGDGRVKNDDINVKLLKEYYEKKSKIYAEIVSKTVNEFWAKQNQKDIEAFKRKQQYNNVESARLKENYEKELDLNMTSAYQQIGQKKPKRNPNGTYGVQVATTGWFNVDAYVIESTVNRATLNYTEPKTGQKAEIKYKPLSIKVDKDEQFDRVLVYLIPDELNSFMRIERKDGVHLEQLNELMIYKLICIGYKGEESFYYSSDNVKSGSIEVKLINTSNATIIDNVNKLAKRSQSKAMNDELSYFAFEKEEIKRQKQIQKIQELTRKIQPVIFPCSSNNDMDTVKYTKSVESNIGDFDF